MQLSLKFMMVLSLLTTLTFAQTKKEQRKLKRAIKKANCPMLKGSYANCSLESFKVDITDEVTEFYNKTAETYSKEWKSEWSEEERKEAGVTKNQFIYANVLFEAGYFELKEMEDEAEQRDFVKTLTKEKVIKILNELGSEMAAEEIKPGIEKAVKSGEFEINWETKLVDGKINFITNEGTFILGQTVDIDGDNLKATCSKKQLKISDGEQDLYYYSDKNNLTVKFVGLYDDAKIKATVTCTK